MKNCFEVQIQIDETKGLLRGLEKSISHTRYNLAYDTIEDLPNKIAEIRKVLTNLESKIVNLRNRYGEKDEDELY